MRAKSEKKKLINEEDYERNYLQKRCYDIEIEIYIYFNLLDKFYSYWISKLIESKNKCRKKANRTILENCKTA